LSSDWQRNQRYEDAYYLPPTAWLPLLGLGYQHALADLIWTRALVYFGEQVGRKGEARFIYEHADAIIALDPDMRAAYRWIAMASLYRPIAPTAEAGYKAVSYLERAVHRWPEDGQLQWDLGATLRFELAPLIKDPAEKERVIERSAEPLMNAARLGAGPAWLALSSSSLLQKLGRKEQALRHLEEMYSTVSDPDVKEQLGERIATLRSQTYAEAFREANKAFEAARSKNYPYLSPSLFLLMGQPSLSADMELRARNFLSEAAFLEEETAP
jgi:hypothetical protein